jgi:hypothetical protein
MNPLMKLTRQRSQKARKKNQNEKSHNILKIMENLITFTLAICVEI